MHKAKPMHHTRSAVVPFIIRDAPGVLSNTLTLLNMYVQNQYFDFLYGHQVDDKGLPTQRFTP